MSFSPQTLVLPSTETGYLTDWTSGWGIEESANFLIDRSKHSNVIVGTEGYFGTLPDGLQIYTDGIPHLTIIGQGLGFTEIPQSLLAAKAYGDEVYLLINQSRNKLSAFSLARLTLIEQYPKPDGDYLVLYRL